MRTCEVHDVDLGGEPFDAIESARRRHVVELGLEQRIMSAAAFGAQTVDKHFERKILMGQRLDYRFLDLPEHFRERCFIGDLGTQHQRVDETSNQPLKLRVATPRHRNAYAQIALPRITMQQRLIRRRAAA